MTPTPPSPSTEPVALLVRSDHTYAGKQGLTYSAGIYADNTAAQHLCMHLLRIPPGGRAKAHVHTHHETAIYLISGAVVVLHGQGLQQRDDMRAGDFFYIPANVPHLPINSSDTEPAVAVVSRTDPNEQESVVLLPELDNVAISASTPATGTPPVV
jgi:uncharacterized RmlC-like cupin family protein